jgi:hypothetical protein
MPAPGMPCSSFYGSGCLLAVAVFLAAGFALDVLSVEGVGDALVGGVGLPVDAVRVDLQQDGDAVPGAAGDFGGVWGARRLPGL